MAHGSPRINICCNCNQYILVPRFSEDPNCPNCGKKSELIDKEKTRQKHNLSIFYEYELSFTKWTKI